MKRGLLAFTLVFLMVSKVAGASVLINEVDADTPGTDTLEFIELYDGGVGNTSLDGLVLVLYNGNFDTSYASFDLSTYSTRSSGYFVIGGTTDLGSDYLVPLATNWLQNGADAVALYQGNISNYPYGTSVTTVNLLDAFVYDTNDVDDLTLLDLLNLGQPQINEGEGGNSTLFSSQRYPDGSGGARNTASYILGTPTPGAANVPLPPSVIMMLSGVAGIFLVKRRRVNL